MHIIVLKYFKQSEISQEKNVLTHKVSHYNNISKFCKVNSSWPWHFIKASNNHSMESYLNIAYLVLWLDTIDKTLWTEHPSLYHCASNYLLWRQLFYSVTSFHLPGPGLVIDIFLCFMQLSSALQTGDIFYTFRWPCCK